MLCPVVSGILGGRGAGVRMRVCNAEVYFSEEAVLRVDGAAIEALKAAALANPSGKARLCAHHGPEESLHEMIIVHGARTYVRPHKHLGRTESFHIIEGNCDVLLFDDGGAIVEVVEMGPFGSGRVGYYRLADPCFHALLVRSEQVVFHETTQGPFRPEDAAFAAWAPDLADSAAVERFMARVAAAADTLLTTRHQELQ